VYVIRGDIIRKGNRYGERLERVLIDREQNVEIDDDFDLWLVEKIIERRRNSGTQS